MVKVAFIRFMWVDFTHPVVVRAEVGLPLIACKVTFGARVWPYHLNFFEKYQAFLKSNQDGKLTCTTTFEQSSQLFLLAKVIRMAFFSKGWTFYGGKFNWNCLLKFTKRNLVYGLSYYCFRRADLANKFYNDSTVTFNFSPLPTTNIPMDIFKTYPNLVMEYTFKEFFLNITIQLFDIKGVGILFGLDMQPIFV
jgi:hypothetical protein